MPCTTVTVEPVVLQAKSGYIEVSFDGGKNPLSTTKGSPVQVSQNPKNGGWFERRGYSIFDVSKYSNVKNAKLVLQFKASGAEKVGDKDVQNSKIITYTAGLGDTVQAGTIEKETNTLYETTWPNGCRKFEIDVVGIDSLNYEAYFKLHGGAGGYIESVSLTDLTHNNTIFSKNGETSGSFSVSGYSGKVEYEMCNSIDLLPDSFGSFHFKIYRITDTPILTNTDFNSYKGKLATVSPFGYDRGETIEAKISVTDLVNSKDVLQLMHLPTNYGKIPSVKHSTNFQSTLEIYI